MKIKESGWAGKAKVSLVLSAVVLFSLVIVQCNSRVEKPIEINKDIHLAAVETNTSYQLSLISDAPMFPGCENLDSEFKIRKCLFESISNHFRENFDLDILTNNPTERKRVWMRLMINQKGEVSLTRSPPTNIYLESEIRRVIKEFPKLIPGIRHGLPVSVRYSVSVGIVDNKIDIKSSSAIY